MKKIVIFLFAIFIVTACKNGGKVSFCTGLDKKGKGIDCGNKFTTGDLTVMIETKDVVDEKNLEIKIYNSETGLLKEQRKKNIEIEPGKKKYNTELSFYDEGKYSVKVFTKDKKPVAIGELRVYEDY